MTNLPDINEAGNILSWASGKNPGPWVSHSETVARAAKKIAANCGMDGTTAHTLGLLHDIGRYWGQTGLRHVYHGYSLLNEKGFKRNAKICLTHSFPDRDIESFNGSMDCTADEMKFLQSEIDSCLYDDYDRLIQLCDAICLPESICLMEVRLVEVARRHGKLNDKILKKWNSYFEIKKSFDVKCGKNIYELFYDEIIKTIIE